VNNTEECLLTVQFHRETIHWASSRPHINAIVTVPPFFGFRRQLKTFLYKLGEEVRVGSPNKNIGTTANIF